MRKLFFWVTILVIGMILTVTRVGMVQAERSINAPGTGKVATRDASSTNIPAAYGSAGAGFLSSLTGKTHVKVINGSATNLGISLGTTTTNCSGGVDNDVVPANGNSVSEVITINSTVCLRSLSGSAVTSGTVYVVVW